MNPHEARSSSEGIPHRPKQSWDIGAISSALCQAPEPARDIAHGPGVKYALAEGALVVELFPPHAERRNGIVRLSTEDSLQEFYRQPQPAIREEGIIFETTELMVRLSPAGELATYRLVPEDRPVAPPAASDDDDRPNGRGDGDDGHSGDSAAPGGAFQNALPETGPQPRVAYGGRLGAAPRTKTTPKGKFVMEFPVAVPVEGREKPEWRDTVVFDEKARRLAGTLERGTYVDVVAYEHARLTKARDGSVREAKEYYATSVTPKVRNRPEVEGARDGQRP